MEEQEQDLDLELTEEEELEMPPPGAFYAALRNALEQLERQPPDANVA